MKQWLRVHVRAAMDANRLAALAVLAVVLLLPGGMFIGQQWRLTRGDVRVIEMIARSPDAGGFAPDVLRVRTGEKVRLRISSPDVVHGLMIPGFGVDVEEIYPGHVTEVDLIAPAPGRYAFACTRWCGVDHWRMRGVIEVTDDAGETPLMSYEEPLYQQLGIDLDADHSADRSMETEPHAAVSLPSSTPSARRGSDLGLQLPAQLLSHRSLGTTPLDAFELLRADPATEGVTDGDLWDSVAWAWLRQYDSIDAERAAKLYARDCAACHGVEGLGDGPIGRGLPGLSAMDPDAPSGPADFLDAGEMFSMSDALLQGKILRGGMGTGMPEFGSLYDESDLWAIVSYLRTFLFTTE